MIRRHRGPIVWFEFRLLQSFAQIRHGCYTKTVDGSIGSYDAIQRSLFANTSVQCVDMEQVHGSTIIPLVTPAHAVHRQRCDGLLTSGTHQCLIVRHADCQACLLYDPDNQVIGAVHAGWRGMVQDIYAKAVQALVRQWGSRPDHLIACVSPSLGPTRAEFVHWRKELPPDFHPFQVSEHYFDLWAVARNQLMAAGLTPDHIETSDLCTAANPDLFFSYRRDGTAQRNVSCIALVPPTGPDHAPLDDTTRS